MDHKNLILTREIAAKKLQRMAYEIVERNTGEDSLILAGIKGSGTVIAQKIEKFLVKIFKGKIINIIVELDKKNPVQVKISPLPVLDDKVIILVDDVANSGRTMSYALKPFLEFYPKKIQTLVLVERTHKLFPVKPDYVGLSVATTLQENIVVEVQDSEVMGAWLH